jgi:hypothetical protein
MNNILKEFITQVSSHVFAPRERTIFSLGGRGYYENAASDLLAFFMKPDAEHGFGPLFLEAFWDCTLKPDEPRPNSRWACIERELRIEGGRIDLEVVGSD